MIATAEQYIESMSVEIGKLLLKIEILDNFYYIFPAIANLDVKDGATEKIISDMVLTVIRVQEYWPQLLRVFSESEVRTLLSEAVAEVVGRLGTVFDSEQFSFYKDFVNLIPNIELPSFEITDLSYKDLDLNSFHLEMYVRFSLLEPFTDPRNGLFYAIGESIMMSKAEVNSFHSNRDFFDIAEVDQTWAGIRIIYLPDGSVRPIVGILQSAILKKRLYYKTEKFENNFAYYNPISLISEEKIVTNARVALSAGAVIPSESGVDDPSIPNRDRWGDIIESLKDGLLINPDYERIFKYILPIKSFSIITILEQLKKDILIGQVIKDNKLFSNIKTGAITTLFKLNNINDPRY